MPLAQWMKSTIHCRNGSAVANRIICLSSQMTAGNGVSMRHAKALFNPEIAPLRLAGVLVCLFAGPRNRAIFDFAFRRAEHKLNVSAMFAGMADDPRSRGWRGAFCRHKIREFLVFITQRAAFQLPMLRGTFHALRKMAPVSGGGH